MSDIEFEIDQQPQQFRSRVILGMPQTPKMANWLLKRGIIKEESQAGVVLMTVVIFNFLVAIILVWIFVF